MKLRELEGILTNVKPFKTPKLHLEQYATDAHIAAHMIYLAATSFDDIGEKQIIDLGCGCGMLSLGALVMGANAILGVDIDEDALKQCKENMRELEVEEQDGIELLCVSVFDLPRILKSRKFDTALLNPPFGTKDNVGMDVAFLETALRLANIVYSMHKSSTREYLVRKAATYGATVTVLAQMKFLIQKQFKFHKQEKVYVDLLRLEKK